MNNPNRDFPTSAGSLGSMRVILRAVAEMAYEAGVSGMDRRAAVGLAVNEGVTIAAKSAPATPAERAEAGLAPDAGGVGEKELRALVERISKVDVERMSEKAAWIALDDIAKTCARATAAKAALDPRRGESGEAIKAQGGTL